MEKIQFFQSASTKKYKTYSSTNQVDFTLPSILRIEKTNSKFEKKLKFRTNYNWNKCETMLLKAIGFDDLFYCDWQNCTKMKSIKLLFCFSKDEKVIDIEVYVD
jgi:hypothetical protein